MDSPARGSFTSLIDLLETRASGQPDDIAYLFLHEGEQEAERLTYRELSRRARALAAVLAELGACDQRALMLFPPGLSFIVSFFGCLYARSVAVPAYPPRLQRGSSRLGAILGSATPKVVLTSSALFARAGKLAGEVPEIGDLRWVNVDEVPIGAADSWQAPEAGPDTLAFLQYTSGSTSAPKGVMVTHGNLLANEEMIKHSCRHDRGSSFVSWLPMYHDMGLIGSVLQPLYLGSPCVLMSPVAFLQKPMRWLRAISRYRAHTSGAPSFAYELCVRRSTPEERAEVDLSSWRIAFNGAEPVRASTLESFATAFSPSGFRREVFFPCYGLAEATLIVTGTGGERPPVVKPVQGRELDAHRVVEAFAGGDGVRYLVGCGSPILDTEVAIVDPETLRRCPPGGVGEIWVMGPGVAQGYWNLAEETERSFRARTAGSGDGPFLRTGDLGFLDDGRLYVTGRLKDLIILRGVNHYPQDLELTVERQHPGLRPGGGAAFSVEIGGEERLVVLQEVEPRWRADGAAVLDSIVQALAEQHEVAAWAVLLVETGAIPKTSSGKVQRFECRRRFLAGDLPVVAERRPDGFPGVLEPAAAASPGAAGRDDEGWLAALVAEKARIDPRRLRRDQPIARQGLDSLGAIELMHEIETRFGVALALPELLEASVAQLAEQIRGALPMAAAEAAAPGGSLPLSYGQRALWFLWRQDPASPAYNIAHAVRVTAPLDPAALRRAFQALLDRHEGLRTSFTESGAGILQQTRPCEDVWFWDEDAAGWSAAELDSRLLAEAHAPFDLGAGPLLRIHRFARGDAGSVLLVNVHHIVADFWSLGVLLAELRDLYAAEVTGRPALLPPLTGRYADHIQREAERLAGPEGERLAAYWERSLAGAPEAIELPADRPRPARPAATGASHHVWLDQVATDALKGAAAGQGATLYMILLAAFHAFLGRLTSRRDLLVGSPSVGRGRAADAGVVGYFVNPLVLRADLAGDPGFEELVARTRRTVLGAFDHQGFPFALLVERLRPQRDGGRSPLVQVTFALQKASSQAGEGLAGFALGRQGCRLRLGALDLESMALASRPLQFDLTLQLTELDGGLAGVFDYDTERFDAATIERLAGHWTALLTAAAASSHLRLSELPLLADAELDQVLRTWNRTGRALPAVAGVEAWIAAQPAEALAVAAGGERLTYGELRRRSARLAAHLRGLGVGPELVVAVFLDRSVELVVSLLAVLEAGGAYLPIDPSTPAARLAFFLEDSAARLVLTTATLAAALPAGTPVVLVDGEWTAQEATAPPTLAVPESLAYVIYTSGSTGRSKGVAVSRASLLNLFVWHLEAFGLSCGDRVSQLAGLGFDASAWEIWPCLAAGASLHCAPEEVRTSAGGVWEWLAAAGITVAFLPTPLAEAALAVERPAGGGLRLLLTGGDRLRLPADLATPFALVNNYGPTESTVVAASGVVEQGSPAGTLPPLGGPIANTRAYLLDAWMQPVAARVPGELYIAGAGLARGYLGRPALTAERFLPDPFAAAPGERLYRTGDLCRFRADGLLEFLGRIDQQVKVRGFRIEPAEIEAVLARHPAVAEVVVEAREAAGGTILAAWAVPVPGAVLAAGELRELAAAELPFYMIPAAFVTLAALPLTANGKIDRQALLLPGPDAGHGGALPRTPVEELLAGLWEELLGVEAVGPEDDFFALGGHSLLVTQLASRVREALGVELSVRAVFETPTLAALAAAVERISGLHHAAATERMPPLTRGLAGSRPRPLSFAQRRLWFLSQLDPESAAYNIPFAARLTGRLDRAALAAAFAEIARRHEAVRTRFTVIEGEPVQSVAAVPPARLPLVDLARLPEAERGAEADRLVRSEAERPFDLAAGRLMRVLLLALGEDVHLALVTLHHVAGDGWSIGVLARELEALYGAYAERRPSPLPELSLQYADFAAWQRQGLSGEIEAAELAYWRAQLAGAPAVIELPSDRPRPVVRRQRGAARSSVLPRPLSEALAALGRREGATLFMTLLSAFQTLLGRCAGGGLDDLVVGTPIAGRNRLETEGLIGFFVNTLALRGNLAGDPPFRELLARTRAAALDAHAHQDLPFERLVEELDAKRDLSHTPLFQVLFSLQNTPAAELSLPGLDVRLLPPGTGSAKFDLTLTATPGSEGIQLVLGYATDLFEGATVRRLLTQFETLLAGVAADPGQRLSELPLLSAGERALLVQWNDSREAYPCELCLHELFEAQADRTPEAVAVVAAGESLTYRELERRANRLAHHLIAQGVGPEVAVAVRLERSLELVVALLAVQKAGGFYVPVDAEYPAERQAFILEDSGARLLLTGEEALLETVREDRPAGRATPDSLLCLIYTSGSTGLPKGVMVRHRGIVNRLLWAQRTYPVTAADRVLHKASYSFDFSLWEIFGPLLAGGSAVLARPGGQRDAAYLARTIADEGVTLVHFVPSMLRAFLAEEEGLERCTMVRAVFSGGEALPPDVAADFLSRSRAVLRNQYGPTESSINATARVCRPDDRPRRTVPIGRPLANCQAYVLDSFLGPVPLGAAGELYLAGDGLARGYLGRAALTAGRFLPDPFGGESGGRMYRTGDMARQGADGEIEFLGRTDHQVKVRGFRIEPGEIEQALLVHPAVRQAVVVAREDAPGDARLVAYLVARDAAPAAAELAAFLRRSLPEHMVPKVFVSLPALPINANGKVDRAALPAAERSGGSWLAPRSPLEELVAGVFAEVLALAEVSAEDDFFELGGHSLLVARLVARVRRAVGVDLPVRTVFEAPTVTALAARIAELSAAMPPVADPVVPVPRDRELPLSFSQQRLWFLDQLEPDSPFYNLPATLRLHGRLDAERVAALAAAFSGVAARHEVLRTVFLAGGGRPRQAVLPARSVPLPVVDLTGIAADGRAAELARLAAADARRPFSLAAGPLLRAALVRLEEGESALLVNLHHIVSDGASGEILVRELAALYRAALTGEPAGLPELSVQYADFAVWQRERLGEEALAEPLAFWRRTLAGLPPLELPADRPRPAVQSFRGATVRRVYAADLGAGLRRLGRREGATLFMTLLAAFSAMLGRYSGQEDFALGSPVAGRDRAEIEGLIGFFVNTLVLRCGLPGTLDVRAALARIREVCLGAYAHQQLPFERLVEELQPQRDLARPPLFQVMLALETRPPALDLAGLVVRRDDGGGDTSRFDLTLSLADREEGLAALLEYSTDLFDAATAERMAEHLGVLLAAVAEEPGRRLADLPLMTAIESRQLLDEWNRTGRGRAETACLHELFAAQVAWTPEAVALVTAEETLTYRELDRRADLVAARVRGAGVGPEVLVGVCLERSADLVASLLGVLKAGGAYLPLDPAYPRERLDFLIRDAAAPVILTQVSLADVLPASSARILLLDGEGPGAEAAAEPAARPQAGNLAYLIYTSGSTGRPKGVAIEHRSAVTFVRWAGEVFSDEELCGVLFATSVCFDLSVFELFVPLSRGGAVILAEDALALAGLPAAGQVTLINTVPSAMAELLRLGAVPPSVRVVNLAGEALKASLVREIEALGTVAAVYNLYGPSEDTTYSTFARVDRPVRPGAAPSIGRPVAQTRVYLVDRELRPVPLGVPGELCLAGAGLARGYLGRPEATAERFVPDPFAGEPGGRLYRTGDLARYREGGNLDFLGRIDRQVKLRGYRIELGEVEAALLSHPGVHAAAATLRDGGAGPQLVGYAVAADGTGLDAEDLRRWLAERLPAPLVPAGIVLLPALPLTPSGKVDIIALPGLPAMNEGEVGEAPGELAARTPAEELIAGIWASVLGRGRVGLHDSFFALGGHSLLATQVVARVRELFRVELPVRAIFQAPTVATLAREVEALRISGLPAEPAIAPVPRGADLPFSFGQQRLWFLDLLEPGSPVYNVPAGLRLSGPLDAAALRWSFGEVVRRHEVLRSSFPPAAGRPTLRIAPWQPLELPVLDLSGLPVPERQERAAAVIAAEARHPFCLAEGPLLRVLLLRLEAGEHVAVVTLHHIVSDAGSLNILLQEVAVLYRARVAGEGSPLPELPVQYADYAAWQRGWLAGDVLAARLAYWRERLADAPILELPTDRPRPPVQGVEGAVASAPLPGGLAAALAGLGVGQGVTPFMTLLAAFGALLSRYSGQLRPLIGTPVSGRRRVETEGLIGFFANTLALRADLDGAPSFAELLARVRDEALGAFDQDLPFEKLVEELRPERSLSHSPLVQVMLSLETPAPAPVLPGLRLDRLDLATGTAKFDLTLFVADVADRPRAALQYRSELFDGSTAVRMLGHFETLLTAALAEPSLPVAALPLMREEERHQLLVAWNATEEGLPAGLTVPAMIAAQAARRPEATALWCDGERWTYGELDVRVARLARRLRRLGVGPETLVAVCAERTASLPLALLATLRAGGAYVPLDPAYPRDRIAFMLEDSRAAVLLTETHLLELLPVHNAAVLCLDRETGEEETGEETGAPVSEPLPENLAYVIYTSGSTGRPKGVAMRHAGVAALVHWAAGVFPAAELDGVLASTSVCFDLSVFELFVTWSLGGRVVLTRNALSLPAVAASGEVRLVNTVPSVLAELLRAGGFPPSVRVVTLAGEPLKRHLVDAAYATGTVERVLNLYGPSEDTTYSTWAVIPPGDSLPPSIGRPLANTRVYLLGAGGGPAPIGIPGELYLGGAGLARGYLGRPGLTAERFVPDPFSPEPGGRLYRTGDLARYRASGEIEFLGRLDHQVKVRGFRIELGEIESSLLALPEVSEAAVLVREDAAGGPHLIAYLVFTEGAERSASELRAALRESLPDYMLPNAFVVLPAMPVLPNGKLDRKALVAPDAARLGVAMAYVEPRTPEERRLAQIWRELLGVERVGVHDNFFELGGHSLLAVQALFKVQEEYGIELPPQRLFEAPTIAGLSELVVATRGRGAAAEEIIPVARERFRSRTQAAERSRRSS